MKSFRWIARARCALVPIITSERWVNAYHFAAFCAIIIGGLGALALFNAKVKPWVVISHDAASIRQANGTYLLRVRIVLENRGLKSYRIQNPPEISVNDLAPDANDLARIGKPIDKNGTLRPDKSLAKSGGLLYWAENSAKKDDPNATCVFREIASTPLPYKKMDLQPGDREVFYANFIIPADVTAVSVFSSVSDEKGVYSEYIMDNTVPLCSCESPGTPEVVVRGRGE